MTVYKYTPLNASYGGLQNLAHEIKYGKNNIYFKKCYLPYSIIMADFYIQLLDPKTTSIQLILHSLL